jgi:hypothetical protein
MLSDGGALLPGRRQHGDRLTRGGHPHVGHVLLAKTLKLIPRADALPPLTEQRFQFSPARQAVGSGSCFAQTHGLLSKKNPRPINGNMSDILDLFALTSLAVPLITGCT